MFVTTKGKVRSFKLIILSVLEACLFTIHNGLVVSQCNSTSAFCIIVSFYCVLTAFVLCLLPIDFQNFNIVLTCLLNVTYSPLDNV